MNNFRILVDYTNKKLTISEVNSDNSVVNNDRVLAVDNIETEKEIIAFTVAYVETFLQFLSNLEVDVKTFDVRITYDSKNNIVAVKPNNSIGEATTVDPTNKITGITNFIEKYIKKEFSNSEGEQ